MSRMGSIASRIAQVVCVGLAVYGQTGCGPTVVCAKPSAWPGEWSGRRLYHTPNAYIYASGDAAAGEADRLAASVSKEYQDRSGMLPSKGLLIVGDAGEEPVVSDLRTMLEIAQRVGLDAAEKKSDLQLQEEAGQAEQEMAEKGFDPAIILRMLPLPLDERSLCALPEFPQQVAAEVEWAAAVPTKAAIREGLRGMLRMVLKQEDVKPAAKVLLLALLPLLEGRMVDHAAVKRNEVLFERMVMTEASWSKDKKKETIAAYRQEKETMGKAYWHGRAPDKGAD